MNSVDDERPASADERTALREMSERNFEEAFDITGHGRLNYLVLLTCGLIMLNVSMESVGMGYVVMAADCDLRLTSDHKGLVTAAAFIGIMSTSFLWGYLGDRCGRRAVMLPALFASAIISIASSFSNNVWTLFILRLFTGCLVSASSATVYAYLGEMHTSARRAAAISWGSAFISLSFIILPGIAWVIIPHGGTYWGIAAWRVFIWSWCVPGIAAGLVLYMLPESPRHLLATAGPTRARQVLADIYSWNHGKEATEFPIKTISVSTNTEIPSTGFVGAISNIGYLLRPPLLRCVFISHTSMFAVFMLSSGLYMWVPDILDSILRSPGNLTICQLIQNKTSTAVNEEYSSSCSHEVSVGVFPISMSMGVVFSITYLAIGFFIDRIGKKRLYSIIMVACGLATASAALVTDAALATALLVVALCCGCAASILAAVAVDVFPTRLRAMAMCVMYMAGRGGAAFGAKVLGATLGLYCENTFYVFGLFTAGSTLLMLFWPDPKKIQSEMEKKGFTF